MASNNEARLDEILTIRNMLIKPENFEDLSIQEQTLWVIRALGSIGSYVEARKTELEK